MHQDFILSTDMVDERNRNDFWRDVSRVIYEVTPADKERGETLMGEVRSRPFGSLIIGSTKFNRQDCRRTRKIIAETGIDFYLLQAVLSGEYRGDFNGTSVLAGPGDVFITDLTQTLDSRKEKGTRLSIVIPRFELRGVASRRSLHGMTFRSERAATRLLFQYIVGVENVSSCIKQDDISGVQTSFISLLSTMIDGSDIPSMMSVGLPVKQNILDYIDANLLNPKLDINSMMNNFRISRSHLYRAFESDGGIAKLIRDRRLDHAHRLL